MSAQAAGSPAGNRTHAGFGGEPPTRHGVDLAASRAMAARLRLMIKGDPEPSQQDWDALGQALWRGDPLADDVASWMLEQGMGPCLTQVELALSHGVAAVPDAPPVLRDFINSVTVTPPWLDERKLAAGARFLQSTGFHGMMVLRDAGLMAGYQASAINQTLVMTGALHSGAHRRVAETGTWWLACTDDGGMARGSDGFRLTLRVRLMHAVVRVRLSRNPQWDMGKLGLPINQVDMQATYLAFSVVQLLALRMTGVMISPKQSDAVMHLWRYIGWLMGVEDDLMCEDEQLGRVLFYRNLISQAPADETSVVLGQALMNEPLNRRYRWAAGLQGRFNRARHLSLVRWFIGPEGMANLGLPRTLPWYPLMMFGPLALHSALLRVLPWVRSSWRFMARRQQTYYRRGLGSGDVPQPNLAAVGGKQARL
jgi:ER-bound oxygenase mpaB/B'/Rubber oxygenase, catalytic domain